VYLNTIRKDIWISVSFDHVCLLLILHGLLTAIYLQNGTEPDEPFEDFDEDQDDNS